jgi:hypothetical protein
MELEKGEKIEWVIKDRSTLIVKRIQIQARRKAVKDG